MRIFFTMTPAFNPNSGGVQRTTFKLGKYFTENGFQVAYFSLAKEGHIDPEYGKLYSAHFEKGEKNPKNLETLEEVLKSFLPDIVINQMPYAKELRDTLERNRAQLGYVLLGCLRNSLFNFKSNAEDKMQQMLPPPLFKLMNNPVGKGMVQLRHWVTHRNDLKAIIDKHNYFILLAPPNREELQYFVGEYKKEKVIAIPNSIPEVYSGAMEKEKMILHVGRLNIPQKRSDLLLDFWEKIYREIPEWKFVIVGDGPYYKDIEADIHRRKLPRVYLEGHRKPEPYYRKAAIFMMPSAFEGFPNTLLEAQGFGCVPLAFNSYAAIEWIVNDGEDAFLTNPFDTRAMGHQALALTGNAEKLKEMQVNAKKNAARFTIDKVGKEWLNLFEELKTRVA